MSINTYCDSTFHGNVGIGTTSPSSRLEVNGEIDANGGDGYRIETKPWANWGSDLLTLGDWDGEGYATRIMGSNSSEVMRVTGNNVGIGTSSPAEKLHVVGSTLIEGSSVELKVEGSGSYDTANITMGNAAKADTFEISLRQDPGDNYATLDYDGYSPTGTSHVRLGANYLDFNTAGSSRMRIDSSGNVGIGTTFPSELLEVSGADPSMVIKNTLYSSGESALVFQTAMGAKYYLAVGPSNALNYKNTLGNTLFTIASGGNVGIGTTANQYSGSKLQVAGGVQMADDTATASADKVGTLRYRTAGNNSYVDMCMQTGASTYAWVNIVTNSW